MGKRWTTKVQFAWLLKKLVEYQKIKMTKQTDMVVKIFLQNTVDEFFLRFPERISLWGITSRPLKKVEPTEDEAKEWPDSKKDDLTAEQQEELRQARTTRTQQVVVWFSNHGDDIVEPADDLLEALPATPPKRVQIQNVYISPTGREEITFQYEEPSPVKEPCHRGSTINPNTGPPSFGLYSPGHEFTPHQLNGYMGYDDGDDGVDVVEETDWLGLDGFGTGNDDEDVDLDPRSQTRRKRYQASDAPLHDWLQVRQIFLDELMRHDAPDMDPKHAQCSCCLGAALSRLTLECRSIESRQRWNDRYFEKTTLMDLGLRVQLGYRGGPCNKPEPGDKKFIVLDISGIECLGVDFCGCSTRPRVSQLLECGWYPTSVRRPRSVVTFRTLRFFELLRLQSKTSAYDFYTTLVRITDNTLPNPTPDRYMPFSRVAREWSHLKMLRRGGRGNVKDGAGGTKEGELALLCPACPQPAWNLPEE
ncbi:hypothetical protein M422DRAFT_262128 [Sphaerobolus stellatus SS14]|uniref:CxC2-like cysteine cluster KDZ transposase-associated domain-containing protein n=1 Tax=Sphaerobolus stellatus (strain SS14) TaxID=990650 RepID=A0A0C9VDQ4_SPHS4|nr:hypothetical protein M422DRAFT_262128 [Sphaerobolus stellatus SS14]